MLGECVFMFSAFVMRRTTLRRNVHRTARGWIAHVFDMEYGKSIEKCAGWVDLKKVWGTIVRMPEWVNYQGTQALAMTGDDETKIIEVPLTIVDSQGKKKYCLDRVRRRLAWEFINAGARADEVHALNINDVELVELTEYKDGRRKPKVRCTYDFSDRIAHTQA